MKLASLIVLSLCLFGCQRSERGNQDGLSFDPDFFEIVPNPRVRTERSWWLILREKATGSCTLYPHPAGQDLVLRECGKSTTAAGVLRKNNYCVDYLPIAEEAKVSCGDAVEISALLNNSLPGSGLVPTLEPRVIAQACKLTPCGRKSELQDACEYHLRTGTNTMEGRSETPEETAALGACLSDLYKI